MWRIPGCRDGCSAGCVPGFSGGCMTGDVCSDGCRNECHAIYSGGCRINTEDPRNSWSRGSLIPRNP